MRDESNHMNFGIDVINTIKQEQPEIWTEEFQHHHSHRIRLLLLPPGADRPLVWKLKECFSQITIQVRNIEAPVNAGDLRA